MTESTHDPPLLPKERARAFLLDLFERFPSGMWRTDIAERANEAGVSMRAVEAQANLLNVRKVHGGRSGSVWRWPSQEDAQE